MSQHTILALTLLLLPIPISFLVPASKLAQPDPWQIRKMRRALASFSLSVAAIYTAIIFFRTWGPQNEAQEQFSQGIFIWSIMSWFFLANLVFVLRRAKAVPFPGSTARSASLVSRRRPVARESFAWWTLRSIWLLSVVVLATQAPVFASVSLVFLVSCIFLLLFGPILNRRQQIAASEPFLPHLPQPLAERLTSEYARRRAYRTWSVILLSAIAVTYKTCLAFLLARTATEHYAMPLLGAAAVTLVVFILVQSILELGFHRRIKRLQRACAEAVA